MVLGNRGPTAILLAGSRPGLDPMADAAGVRFKTLIPVAGEAMLSRTARALITHPAIARVIIVGQSRDMLLGAADTAWLAGEEKVAFAASEASISVAVSAVLRQEKDHYPFLVTTADNVLLDHPMIDHFLGEAAGADVAVAMVERHTLLAHYPGSRRTWLRFRGGAWSGANLFWMGSPGVLPLLDLWRGIEQDRKKGMKVIGAFGPLLLLGAALRLLTIQQAVARAGRRFGVIARIVAMPQAEACIDVDKPDDLAQVEEILAARRASAS